MQSRPIGVLMKSRIFSAVAIVILTLLLGGCGGQQPPKPGPGSVETVTPPEKPVPTVSLSPLPSAKNEAQYIVPDAYTGAHHYRITYVPEEWRVELPGKSGNPNTPELAHLKIEGCRLYLREGARDSPAGVTVHEVSLGGYTWGVYNVGASYPNHAVYILYQPDKGISFIIGLDWPRHASNDIQQTCRLAAETVLDTFFILD